MKPEDYFLFYYSAILLLNDTYFYGYCKEFLIENTSIAGGVYSNGLIGNIARGIFNVFKNQIEWLMKPIIKYRVYQKIPEIGGLVYLSMNHLWFLLGGAIWAFLWLVFDFLYYPLLGQSHYPRDVFDSSIPDRNPFWLQHRYTIAGWVLIDYSYKKFKVCFIIGITGMLISTIIQILVNG